MHEAARNGGAIPSQVNEAPRAPTRRKAFAVLPDKAPQILVDDTSYVRSPELSWPHRCLDNRRVFQALLHRYRRQILYGCTNPQCETPTCLSYQKRVSKKPFRRFTVLSARTLATFLASQDNPENGLCPHEAIVLSNRQEPEWLQKSFNDRQRSKAARSLSSMSRESASQKSSLKTDTDDFNPRNYYPLSKTTPHVRKGPYSDLQTSPAHFDSNDFPKAEAETAKMKDPKSLTQNLFDALNMRELHFAQIPKGLLRLVSWINFEKPNPSPTAPQPKAENNLEKLELAQDTPPPHEQEHSMMSSSMHNETLTDVMASSRGFQSLELGRSSAKPCHINTSDFPSPVDAIRRNLNSGNRAKHSTVLHQNAHSMPICQRFKGGITTFSSLERNNSASSSPATDLDDVYLEALEPSQTLDRFSFDNIRPFVEIFRRTAPRLADDYTFYGQLGRTTSPFCFSSSESCTNTVMHHAFGVQSIFHIFGSVDSILKSFVVPPGDDILVSQFAFGFIRIVYELRLVMSIDYHPRNVFSSLWSSASSIYVPASTRTKTANPKAYKKPHMEFPALLGVPLDNVPTNLQALSDHEAAHVGRVVLASLVAFLPIFNDLHALRIIRSHRSRGRIAPEHALMLNTGFSKKSVLEAMDALDDDMGLSLVGQLVKAISSRRCISEMSKRQLSNVHGEKKNKFDYDLFMEKLLCDLLDWHCLNSSNVSIKGFQLTSTNMSNSTTFSAAEKGYQSAQHYCISAIVEWLRSLILHEWDGKGKISRWGTVGGSLEFMSFIFNNSSFLKTHPEIFHMPFLYERLDLIETPAEWLSSQDDANTTHVLSYPFLFSPPTLVNYFRAINHAAMFKAFESSWTATKLMRSMNFEDPLSRRGELRLHDRLISATNEFLVLEIRRECFLTDAFDQLWRRKRHDLMKPLKVLMGLQEGEEGVDHGGVQQEFFRMATSEIMDPGYGLFTTDSETRISWFQPCSLEPLYKFELLGLLTSLAVYNGLTLPVTFPHTLYRKLLDEPVTKLEHIQDGWPSLARGLHDLLTWTDGDVEDVFVRSYVFSIDVLGKAIFIDMKRTGRDDSWPSMAAAQETASKAGPPSDQDQASSHAAFRLADYPGEKISDGWFASDVSNKSILGYSESLHQRSNLAASQACMVTNQNRDQYVEDYIFWLTDKSIRPQYEAFARGFYTCIDRKATSIFSPEALKNVVEGTQDIDVNMLERTAKYAGGYSNSHRVIKDFWSVVHEFSIRNLRRLLEFVTASDRIPVSGIQSILFMIHKNGENDERLPQSSTCYGRLLLPEYSSREKLKEKLLTAIENSKGFGFA